MILDLRTDSDGRPTGNLQADQDHPSRFGDWLDLLRLLEGCINRAITDPGGIGGARSNETETTT